MTFLAVPEENPLRKSRMSQKAFADENTNLSNARQA